MLFARAMYCEGTSRRKRARVNESVKERERVNEYGEHQSP